MKLSVACIQLNSGSNIEANIRQIEHQVGDAARKGAKLITLPENCFLMEEPGQGSARTLYTADDHPGIQAASNMARAHKVWLLVGSLAIKTDDSGKTVNRSLLFDDQGQQVAHYDKIHLFDVTLPTGEVYAESSRFLPGGQSALADTPWGKIGMTVCYDVRFPHLYRQLAQAGADIIVVPAAFTSVTGEAHWHILLRSRAIENGCFVIAPAQTGTHPGGRKTYGHSLIIDPWGTVLADAGSSEGMVMAELDLSQVAAVRSRIPSLQHDRPFT
jgi:predicted amidohydrolase